MSEVMYDWYKRSQPLEGESSYGATCKSTVDLKISINNPIFTNNEQSQNWCSTNNFDSVSP